MAVAAHVYGELLNVLANKGADLATDSLKVMLCTSAYTPSQDAHHFQSDITSEVTGTGYIAGGVALAGVSCTYSTSTGVLTLTATSPSWSNSTITARYAVFYDATPGTAATNPLLCYWDFGADESSSNGTFTLTIAAGGIINGTVS